MNLIEENQALRARIKVLEEHIHSGIECGFFCALPECARGLTQGERHGDQENTSSSQAVERPACFTGSQPF